MIARLLIALIRLYQLTLSRLLPPACRFEPSCSRYAAACLEMHGAARGSLLSIVRLCKCHPFHPGGYDPPPPRRTGATLTQPSHASHAAEQPAPLPTHLPRSASAQADAASS